MLVNEASLVRVAGLVVPMVTPLRHGVVDVDAVPRLVRFLTDGGVDGLFLLGTTGEGPSLPEAERRRLVASAAQAAREAGRRVTVVVNISGPCATASLSLAQSCASCGVDAVALTAPSYYPLNEGELTCYFEAMVDASPLPVVLYNMPSHARHVLPVAMVRALASRGDVIGIKDSGVDAAYLDALLEIKREVGAGFTVLCGPLEPLGRLIGQGGDGGVLGSGHLWPGSTRALIDAARHGDAAEVQRLAELQVELQRWVVEPVASCQMWTMAIKEVMSHWGLCEAEVLSPLRGCTEREREGVLAGLATLGLFDASSAQRVEGATA